MKPTEVVEYLLNLHDSGVKLATVCEGRFSTVYEKAKFLEKNDIAYLLWKVGPDAYELRVAPADEMGALNVLGLIQEE